MARKGRPLKRDFDREMIIHAYDSFLVAQTRIYTLAHSSYNYLSSEIKSKQTILFLDDVVQISISCRRLFDLIGLKDFSNNLLVQLAFFENMSEPKEIIRVDKKVSIRRILNSIVHSRQIYFFHDRLSAAMYFREIDPVVVYRISERASREKRWKEYTLEPSMFVVPDAGAPLMFLLSDFVEATVVASDKIADVCAEENIFLEVDYRGGV